MNLGQAVNLDPGTIIMHQMMLADQGRIRAYDEALRQAVSPGDVVVDVGAGLLILSQLALRHGADHVYAIEGRPDVAALASLVADQPGLRGRITVIQDDARTVQLGRPANVIVSEMMGNIGPEEQMGDVLAAVADRNLCDDGRVVPSRMVTNLAAIQFDAEGWGLWADDFWGYSLRSIQDYVRTGAQLHFFNREPTLLGAPSCIDDTYLGSGSTGLAPSTQISIDRPGTLHAIIGFFEATLSPGVSLSNFPGYPGCNWAVWVWPLRHTEVEPGTVLDVDLIVPDDVRSAVDWQLRCGIRR